MSVFGSGNAGERSANNRVFHLLLPGRHLPLSDGDVGLLLLQLGFERVRCGLRVVEIGLGGDFVPQQVRNAAQLLVGLFDPHPGLLQRFAGRFQLRLGQAQTGLHIRIVETGQNLAFLHLPAFLDQQFDDFAGNFGRHGRFAPCRHIAGSIQHRTLQARTGGRASQNRSHLDGFRTEQPPPADRQ